MSSAIELDGVWKFYGDFAALRDYSLQIPKHTCWAMIGRNGAGKTTLLRIAAGLSPFERGRVRVLGRSPRDPVARRNMGFLGHGMGIYEDLSARENLRFFGQIVGLAHLALAVNQWLERVGLDRVADMPVRQFSRGMRQRLALARTFLHAPDILLLDEPFTSLDDRAIATLAELLMEARERGATIVLSTHQIREALAIATHVAVIEKGLLRYAGERTQEMLDDAAMLYRQHTELGTL